MGRRLAALAAVLALAAGVGVAVYLSTRSSGPSATRSTALSTTRPGHSHAKPRPASVRASAQPVPILMYHVLATAPANAAYPSLFVPPAEFAAQASWFSAHGYHAVTLKQLFDAWHGRAALPAKPVVFTFDDGYLSDYTVALPTLRSHGWSGVLNLVLKNLVPGDIQPWQVRKLVAAGWELGAHTITHADLTTVGPTQLHYEVAGSRAVIRRKFGVPVDFFCYPAGRYDAQVIAAVKAAGYWGATTENAGLGRPTEPFTLARVRVDPGDGVSGLLRKLRQDGAAS